MGAEPARKTDLFNAMEFPGQICDMFARAATGFAVTGCNGKVIHANQALAAIIDPATHEIIGANLFELTHPVDQARDGQLLKQLLSAEIPAYVMEKRFGRKDGTHVWVRNSVFLLWKDSPGAGYLVHICEDISGRKQAEQILERQEQMAAIGRLTSSIVHEINNPLEAVFNLIFLARHSEDLEQASPYLKQAEQELGRASEITLHGLQFHRQSAQAEPANINHMLETVLMLFQGKFRSSKVRVELETQEVPELLCFAGELRQVFVNLFGNGVESMPEGGLLRIRARPGRDWRTGSPGVRVTVADTGAGMSEETRRRLYEPFYTTKGARGSGLGLWVTANIVRKHEGNIHMRSRNTGTVFSLFFPTRGAEGKAAGFQDAA